MKILVVGGGTAGLISALILKKRLNAKIDIVHSSKIGIIGVGEGSTEHFAEFALFMGFSSDEIIRECGATFKSGTFFKNWNKNDKYFHHVSPPYCDQYGQYSHIYGKIISENSKRYYPESIEKNFINLAGYEQNFPFNQFHFDTYKLNFFLTKKCLDLGIKVYDDKINNIYFKQNGEIDKIVGNKKEYNYDFYIDSTGFKRMLIGKMGAKWVSFKEYLKMKSAIVFPTKQEENYNLWTLSEAMSYGWMFKIPTSDRNGNGYIFDSDYISPDKAKEELDKYFKKDLEISNTFNFDPGYLENVWIKNCVAVGLSGSFVEPLEATSIGTSIQQSFMLMHKIPKYSQNDIDKYNKSFTDIMKNIRDFIFLHYIVKREDTEFWKDIKNIKIPESLEENLSVWKNRLPIKEDFSGLSNYLLFFENNFTVVMHGLKLFDTKKIKKEYMLLNNYIHNHAEEQLRMFYNFEKQSSFVTHKEFIKSKKENYL